MSINPTIIWFQASGKLKEGDFVVCREDPIIIKWDGETEVPIGRVTRTHYAIEFKHGDRVPVKSIWYCGKLIITLTIGDRMYPRGSCRDYVERAVKGLSDDEIYKIYEKKNIYNELIYQLEKMRDEL